MELVLKKVHNMSEWSGNLYFFYSEKEISDVFRLLIDSFQSSFGYSYQDNEFPDEMAILFYKDQNMLISHYENGYQLNSQGLGCVGIEAKNVSINGIAQLHTFDGSSDFEPYDIHLVFRKVFYYTLVLPDIPDRSDFCYKVYQIFHKALI